jgi:mRNA interferase MazF
LAATPSRKDVWLVDLEPVRGHEQGRTRPCVVVSDDLFNHGPAGLVVVVPLTTRDRGIPLHVRVDPPDGGLQQPSFIKCEDVRSISVERLLSQWGAISDPVMREVEDRLRILLHLF